jgi:hypothetical protein
MGIIFLVRNLQMKFKKKSILIIVLNHVNKHQIHNQNFNNMKSIIQKSQAQIQLAIT